ncbi:hypothetical protein [Armatimonas rosea]|uniref:Uncharacterized protein n=1 Tax=Armatimonas rosea TaxID=685828 RepID=A0A7W9SSD9_ARMRO|nr:hypothetical protein [Armatimonas rosea]MBB6051119.1 hypothetical protein [Armatimonas rosea]
MLRRGLVPSQREGADKYLYSRLGLFGGRMVLYSALVNRHTHSVTYGDTTWVATRDGIKRVTKGQPVALYLPGREVLQVTASADGAAAVVRADDATVALYVYESAKDRWRLLAQLACPKPEELIGLARGGWTAVPPPFVLLLTAERLSLAPIQVNGGFRGSEKYTPPELFVVERTTGVVRRLPLDLPPLNLLPRSLLPLAMVKTPQGQVRFLSTTGELYTVAEKESKLALERVTPSSEREGDAYTYTHALGTETGEFWAIRLGQERQERELQRYELAFFDSRGTLASVVPIPAPVYQKANEGRASPPTVVAREPEGTVLVVRPRYQSNSRAQTRYSGEALRYSLKTQAWVPVADQDRYQPHHENAWNLPPVPLTGPPEPTPGSANFFEARPAWHVRGESQLFSNSGDKSIALPEPLRNATVLTTNDRAIWGIGERVSEPKKIVYFYVELPSKACTLFDPPVFFQNDLPKFCLSFGEVLGSGMRGVFRLDRATKSWSEIPIAGQTASARPRLDADPKLPIVLLWTQEWGRAKRLYYRKGGAFVPVGELGEVSAYLLTEKQLLVAAGTALVELRWRDGIFVETKRTTLPWPGTTQLFYVPTGALWGWVEDTRAFCLTVL